MRILIADDHALFRDSLRSLLEAHGFEVVGEARDGKEAVALARQLRPDVVLMDLSMPELDGIAATKLIAEELPAVKVVVLTASEEDAKLFEAIRSGALGYLSKNLESDEFFTRLDGVRRGEPALPASYARRLMQEFARPPQPAHAPPPQDPDALTDREREVLELLVQGVTSNRRLAKQLGVSENTVKFHVRNILDKLHLHDRAQLVSHALRHGLVKSPEGT